MEKSNVTSFVPKDKSKENKNSFVVLYLPEKLFQNWIDLLLVKKKQKGRLRLLLEIVGDDKL